METLRCVSPDVLEPLESEPSVWPSSSAERMLREAGERANGAPESARSTAPEPASELGEEDEIDIVERLLAFAHLLTIELGRATAGFDDPLTALRTLKLVAERPGIGAMEVERGLGVTRVRMSMVLTRLLRTGLLQMSEPPLDRRRRVLHCAEPGRRMADEFADRLDGFGLALFGHLGPEGRRRLRLVSRELLGSVERARARRLGDVRAERSQR